MRIAIGSLFFASAILLNFIELSTQERVYLEHLFPYYLHLGLPAIEKVRYNALTEREKERLWTFGSAATQFNGASTLYRRASFIIGYESDGYIRQITSLHQERDVIYDRDNEKFVELISQDIGLLGVDNRVRLAKEVDLIVASYRTDFRPTEGVAEHLLPRVSLAQSQATYEGMLQAVSQAHVQARLQIRNPHVNHEAIFRAYVLTYQAKYRSWWNLANKMQ